MTTNSQVKGSSMKGKKLSAFSLLAVSALILSGCSSSDSAGVKIEVPDIPMHESMGDFEGEINIVNWAGFVDPKWTDKFEADTGCMVKSRTAGTSDEMVTLMRTGQYDIVSASGDAALRLIVGGDVQPLNVDLIPNFGDEIATGMRNNIYDTVNGKPYGVPIGRGANLLQYNDDVTKGAPTSWDVVWETNSPYKGKITAYDAPIYIADAAVYLMYHKPELGILNPYALDQTQLDAAIALLKQQNTIIGEYWSDAVAQITSFAGGNTVVGTSWEILRKFAGKPNLKTTLPVEGSTGWYDSWLVSSKTKNVNCAYAWMDYTSTASVNGAIAMNFGMAPANIAFCSSSAEAQAHCDEFAAEDEEFFKQIWPWTTPIETCVDGRKDVKCTSFQEWTNAWATIKG
jgi:putative spermidine/putrescine transport system substrate-binding protein